MNIKHKMGLAALATGIAGEAAAQAATGYAVSWGTLAVPMSPWASALIGLLLAASAYSLLRQRAGRALMIGGTALLMGGITMMGQDSVIASPVPTDTITTTSGSMTLMCDAPHLLSTTVPGGVTLRVSPIGSTPTIQAGPGAIVISECTTGTHLNPGDNCGLCFFDADK